MSDLSVKYMGLALKNPIIVGSSGLTNSIENLIEIEKADAGAVVIKSIFEEQILIESDKFLNSTNEKLEPMKKGFNDIMDKRNYDYLEALDYINNFAKENTLDKYLQFIVNAKKSISIPIIASINCVSPYDWHYFAKRIQNAGADAIELNIYLLPSNPLQEGSENEKVYFEIAKEVQKYITIPVSLKISYYFSGLAQKVIELSKTGIKGLVLFNRPYSPDIDINTLEISSTNIYSSQTEYSQTLRWIAILAGRTDCDIVASTGIHDYTSVIKQILAGATAVQMASVFYKKGFGIITETLKGLEDWMKEHKFNSINDFRGKLSQINIEHPAAFERVQFMKLYSKIE